MKVTKWTAVIVGALLAWSASVQAGMPQLPTAPNQGLAADVCVIDVDVDAVAAPGGVLWKIALTNERAEDCHLMRLDFPATTKTVVREAAPPIAPPAVPGGDDCFLVPEGAPPGVAPIYLCGPHGPRLPGTRSVVVPQAFDPDLSALAIRGGGDACSLASSAVAGEGSFLTCEGLLIGAEASVVVDVWTAALNPPPARYCFGGYAQTATDSVPVGSADCVDVYRDAIMPAGVVVEGPIAVGLNEQGQTVLEWIGGNYSEDDFTSASVALPVPAGTQVNIQSTRAWRCDTDAAGTGVTCTTPFLAQGIFPAIRGVISRP